MKAQKRSDSHGRSRCPGHDYYSRCIYHIVLNKADYIPRFSEITGTLTDRNWPPFAQLSPTGQHIADALSALKQAFPFTSILRRCIMPDHVHFVIFIKEDTTIHLSTIISHLKKDISARFCLNLTEKDTHLFVPDYNDTILRFANQLDKMLSYVSDNPRRYLLKKLYPGNHRRFTIEIDGCCYDAYGNWDLLEIPEIEAVKVSRRYTPQQLLSYKKSWVTNVYNGGLLVSPFIHPQEKKVRDWAEANCGNLAIITTEPFDDRYKPQGSLFELCAEGRGIVISAHPRRAALPATPAQPAPPAAQMGQSPSGNGSALCPGSATGQEKSGKGKSTQFAKTVLTKAECERMNQLAAKIAAGSFRLHL